MDGMRGCSSSSTSMNDEHRQQLVTKCGTICNGGVDRISQLPNHLIVPILSLLPFKEAGATCILSTRWSDLWRYIPTLDLDGEKNECMVSLRVIRTHVELTSRKSELKNIKYIEWVNSVMESSHKGHHLIKQLNICIPQCKSGHSAVKKWLEFAILRRVEVLQLSFYDPLPSFVRVYVVVLEDVLRETKPQMFVSTNNYIYLKSLCLRDLVMSTKLIELFLLKFPLLEKLIIECGLLKSDLEVCGGEALKHLTILCCIPLGGKSIKLCAPNLTSLKIQNAASRGELLFEINAPKLVSAHITSSIINNTAQEYDALMRTITSQLPTLHFSLHCLKGFREKGLIPQMLNLRELIVTYQGKGIKPITSLLCALPFLEKLKIKNNRNISINHQSMEAGINDDVERFCHCHLTVFKFTGFDVDEGDSMELVSYIVDNCVALKKICVRVLPWTRVYAKQLLQPKIPNHIQLIIVK